MMTRSRHHQRESSSRIAIPRRSPAAEPDDLDAGAAHGLATLLAGGGAKIGSPSTDRRRLMGAAAVLALQRTHGNAHVGRLVRPTMSASSATV